MYYSYDQPRFKADEFLAAHPEPTRRTVSEALWVAEGKVPMDAGLHARIRQVVDMTSKAEIAVSHTQVASMAHCTALEVTQFYEGRCFLTTDLHPHTERAYQIALSQWAMALAQAVAAVELPGLCLHTEDYAEFRDAVDAFHSCHERDNYRHNHAEAWAQDAHELAAALRHFWHLGNRAPRVPHPDDL